MENIGAFASDYREQLITAPNIIMGAMEIGPEDPNPSALLCISYPSVEEASAWARFFMSYQSGVKPFQSGPDIFVGDTSIKVDISSRAVPGKGHLCQVMLKADPKHLTYAFYTACYVSPEARRTFCTFYDLSNSYVFTVSCGGALLLNDINLVKYTITTKGV
mgnify:CR=1 FL=1